MKIWHKNLSENTHTHTHTNNSDFSDFLMDHKNEMQKQEEDIKNRSPSALKG